MTRTNPPVTEEAVGRLWDLRRRALSYASDKPAVNLLLADLAEGLEVAIAALTKSPPAMTTHPMSDAESVARAIAAIDAELGRQGETMPEIAVVGEPDDTRIRLDGTFDLDGIAQAALTAMNLDAMREALVEARLQLEYLDGRFPTGTTPAVLAKIDAALKEQPHG